MTTTTAAPSPTACAEALAGIAPTTFDCVQSNLALLSQLLHGGDAAARLGMRLTLASRPLDNGLRTFDPEPEAEVGRCAALLGLTAVEERSETSTSDLAPELSDVWYVVADAHEMPWLPYHGRAHMPHSFLLGGTAEQSTLLVVDAYDNQTEWGPAEPGCLEISPAQLDFPARLWRWRATEPVAPEHPVVERSGTADYLAAFAAHPDRAQAWQQLAVDSWLLARWFSQHARAHQGRPEAGAAADTAASWQRLASEVFLGLRRVRRGRPEPESPVAETERLLTLP